MDETNVEILSINDKREDISFYERSLIDFIQNLGYKQIKSLSDNHVDVDQRSKSNKPIDIATNVANSFNIFNFMTPNFGTVTFKKNNNNRLIKSSRTIKCQHVFTKGAKKGMRCGKNCNIYNGIVSSLCTRCKKLASEKKKTL